MRGSFCFNHVLGPENAKPSDHVSSTCKGSVEGPWWAGREAIIPPSRCKQASCLVPAWLGDRRKTHTKLISDSDCYRDGQSPEMKLCLQFKVIIELFITRVGRNVPGPGRDDSHWIDFKEMVGVMNKASGLFRSPAMWSIRNINQIISLLCIPPPPPASAFHCF